MENIYISTLTHLFLSLLLGGLIDMERTYNGRPAGFRTHSLVCMASSLLMLLTVYQMELLPNIPIEIVRIDPTRMGQGIMTGIGFLGAGVIMKEGMSIRGLTTAASIWITAAIGIIVGIGFYFAAIAATLLTIGTLSLFRWFESVTPSLYYGRLQLRTHRKHTIASNELDDLIINHDCTSANPSYHLEEEGKFFEYKMTIRTRDKKNFLRLAQTFTSMENVLEFNIYPTSD